MSKEGDVLEVELTKVEMYLAMILGGMRNISSCNSTGLAGQNTTATGFQDNITGAMGEMAFAKAIGAYWQPSVNTFKSQPDQSGVEVRATHHRHGKLIIRPEDKDDASYVLVINADFPRMYIVGWISGREAKTHEEWLSSMGSGRPPAFFVPQQALHSIDQLIVSTD